MGKKVNKERSEFWCDERRKKRVIKIGVHKVSTRQQYTWEGKGDINLIKWPDKL